LALTKELIELHKGKITVNSKEGEGTEFIINLPRGDFKIEKEQLVDPCVNNSLSTFVNNDLENIDIIPNDPGLDIPGKSASQHTNKNRNVEIILIVEDNSDVRAYICEQLEKDYKVFEAINGEDGIYKAQKEIPDLIITDVIMPKMNGYQFSKNIRNDEKTSHIPLIMLTAKTGLDDKIQGLETGIDAYLTKPFNAKELKVRVKEKDSPNRQ